jgi:cell division protein FtsQ
MGNQRSRLGGIVALSLIGLTLVGWVAAFRTGLFHARDVKVVGVVRVDAAEIERLAAIGSDDNLLLLDEEAVSRRVREHPWIASAEVTTRLPSTVVLRVAERRPIAWVAGPEGGALVAPDGTVLTRRRQPGIHVRVGSIDALPDPGAVLGDLRPSLRVVASLPPRVRRSVARVELREGEHLLHLRDGARVRYGGPESLEAKRAALESILAWVAAEGVAVAYIDLRAPDAPAVRPIA